MSEGITFAEIMSLCNVHANLMGSKVNTETTVADFEQPGHPVHVMKMENFSDSRRIRPCGTVAEELFRDEG